MHRLVGRPNQMWGSVVLKWDGLYVVIGLTILLMLQPLLMSSDLRQMPKESKDILQNQ